MILELVVNADIRLAREGIPFREREGQIMWEVHRSIGGTRQSFDPVNDALVKEVHDAIEVYYGMARPRLELGRGIVPFIDTLYLVKIPLIFGTVRGDPLAWSNLTETQLSVVQHLGAYEDLQKFACDAHDFYAGCDDALRKLQGDSSSQASQSRELLYSARRNFMAACNIAAHSIDTRETTQSFFIAVELSAKALLSLNGSSSRELVSLSHNIERMLGAVRILNLGIPVDVISRLTINGPNYVDNRYGKDDPTLDESADFALISQFIAAELMRTQSDRGLLPVGQTDRVFLRPRPKQQA
jgi:hypothetical protein